MKTHGKQTRKEHRVKKGKEHENRISVPVVNAHAAGIDVASTSLFVCMAQDNVKEFSVYLRFTPNSAAFTGAWSENNCFGINGFYWKPLFVMLQSYGFEVYLVNARHKKNVKGHKTDVVDAGGYNSCTVSVYLQTVSNPMFLPTS